MTDDTTNCECAPSKETSARMSTMAALYMRVTADGLRARVGTDAETVAADIRAMAASLLSQDLTRGQ